MRSKSCVCSIFIVVLALGLMVEKVDKKGDTNWPGFRGHMAKGIAEGFPNLHFC